MPKQLFKPVDNSPPNVRIENVSHALKTFQDRTHSNEEDTVADLLTDLMHWCVHHQRDFNADLQRARTHFDAEPPVAFTPKSQPSDASANLTLFDLGTFIGFDLSATAEDPFAGFDSLPELDSDLLPSSMNLDHWFEERELKPLFSAEEVVERMSCLDINFRPAGDHPGVNLVFDGCEFVPPRDVLDLIRLLDELGGDSPANFLKIACAIQVTQWPPRCLTVEQIHEMDCAVYSGGDIESLRQQAEGEVLGRFGPSARRTWDREMAVDGPFDTGPILHSPDLWVRELTLGNESALLVALRE
jgi:hypothetical protein